jgi:hypothetical protein
MDSRFLMTLQVAVVGAQKIGAMPHGTRVTVTNREQPRISSSNYPPAGSRSRSMISSMRDGSAA